MSKQKVLVLGHQGMLGHQVFKAFWEHPGYETYAPVRNARLLTIIPTPDIVINCIGVTPRHPDAHDPAKLFTANAVLPHRLHAECSRLGARLIHVSTDCVFLGAKGNYSERDCPDAIDSYGVSKLIGEVDATNALTIRTSLIGPELRHQRGLLEWFLAQQGLTTGYTNAIFSGVTTLELAKVLRDVIAPRKELFGIFHVGGEAISKFDLLALIKAEYGHDVVLARNGAIKIDRSLDPRRFELMTGYKAPPWAEMIKEMRRVSR